MHCPSCGYPIDQQNLERCPRCGYALTPTAASGGQGDYGYPPRSNDPGSTGGYVPPQPPENPYGGYGNYGGYGGYGNVAPPSGYGPPQQDPSSPYGQYGQGQYGQPAPPSGYGQPAYGQPAYGQPAPPSGYGQPPYGQPAPSSYPLAPGYPPPGYGQPTYPSPPQKKNRTGLIVGIIVAVVVVLVACTGGTIFAIRALGQTPDTGGSPTATTASGTATPEATSTPALTVIYQDTFASDASGWLQDGTHCYHASDGYHVAKGYECFAPVGLQSDVDVSVKVQQVSGPTTYAYGIAFRRASAGNSYDFMIDSNGKWLFSKCVNQNCTTLVDFTPNNAIQGGLHTPNTIEVTAKGSHFDFSVNGAKMGSYDDSTFTSGKIGLLAAGDTINCAFTNLVISRPS